MYKFVLFFCNEFLFVLIFLIVLRYAGCVFPTRCFMREGNVRRSSRRCTAFFWTLPCFHFGFGTRTETEESSPPKEKIGRVFRRSAPHTRGIRMCQKAAPVAHSLSCLRFFGRSSHIPRLFLLLVSVPSRLLFSEIAAPATFFILRRASRHLLTR